MPLSFDSPSLLVLEYDPGRIAVEHGDIEALHLGHFPAVGHGDPARGALVAAQGQAVIQGFPLRMGHQPRGETAFLKLG